MQPEYNDQPLAAQAESAAETMKRVERELRSPAVPFETGAGVSKMPGQLPSQQATARMTAGPLSAMGVAAADPQTQALQALIAQSKLNVGPVEVGYQRAQPMAQGARPQQTVSVGGRPFDADTYFAAQASQGPGGRSYGATVGRDGLNAYGQYNPARKDVNVGMQFQRAFADGGPVMPSTDPMEGFSIEPGARPAMQPQSRVGTGIGGALSRMGQGISDSAIVRGAGEIPGTVANYFRDVTAGPDPSQRLGQDLGKLGSMVYEGVKQDPIGAVLDVLPVVGEIRSGMDASKYTRMADEAEAAGDEPKASTFRQLAAMAAAGTAPLAGVGARLAKRGAKAGIEGAEVAAREGSEAAAREGVEGAAKAVEPMPEYQPVMQAFTETPEPAALRDSVVSKIAQSIDDSAGDTAKLPTVSGLGPQYIVDSGVEDVVKKNSFLLASTKNNNAEKQLNGVASLLDEFPDMALDPEQWVRGFSKATGERNVIAPPYRFMKAIADGEYTELLRGLTPGQISDADAGFAAGKDFLKAYHAGQMGVEDTGKMFMWGIMSRGVNPFTHEGLFLDAFNGIEPWIKMAAEGKFTKEVAEGAYKDWAATTAPKGSGQPGSGAMHNLNAFGKDFLLKMSQPDKAGVTPLQKLHDLMADPSKSGRDIRREFARVGEGVGIDNKVVSFILLATGRDDVMVIDRIQLKNLWDDGRYADTNIWDGISVPTVTLKDDTVKRFPPTDEGRAAAKDFAAANPGSKGGTAVVTGSSLAEATYGAKGILIYEAIEDALMKNVQKIYADLGRPDAASPGRFHWETWVARSNQEASHGTLPAILKKVQGSNNPLADVYSKQGDYQSYAYGAKYMRDAEGNPMFSIPLSSGREITMTPQQYQSALAQMRKPKYGVVPKKFKVTETEGMPWYEREGVNRSKLDDILRAAAGQEGAIRKALGGPISYGSGDRAGGRSAAGVEAPQAGVNINQATQEVLSEIRQKADEGDLDQRKIAYLIRMSATGTFKPESAYNFAGEILEGDLEAIRDRFAKFPRTLRILSRLDRALGGEAGRQYGVAANPRQDWQPIPLDGAAKGFAKGGKVKARKPARVGSKGAMEEFSALAERMYGAKVAKNIIGRSDNTPTKVMFAMNQYAKNLMLSNPQRYAAGYKAQLRELNEIAKKYKIGARQAFNRGEDVNNTKKELNEALQSKPARDNAAFSDAIKRLLYILR